MGSYHQVGGDARGACSDGWLLGLVLHRAAHLPPLGGRGQNRAEDAPPSLADLSCRYILSTYANQPSKTCFNLHIFHILVGKYGD